VMRSDQANAAVTEATRDRADVIVRLAAQTSRSPTTTRPDS